MAVYMVTWNLNKERGNYAQARQAFIQHLDRYPNVSDSGLSLFDGLPAQPLEPDL